MLLRLEVADVTEALNGAVIALTGYGRPQDVQSALVAGFTAHLPKPADMSKVMKLIRRDGALTIRDIEDDVLTEKAHLWASRKPSKRALQLMFYAGVLTISERIGMLKTYELMQRHFGWDKPPKPASAREVYGYLLDRSLRAQGVVSLDSICHLDAPRTARVGSAGGAGTEEKAEMRERR